MSDATQPDAPEETTEAQDAPNLPKSQAELDAIIQARLTRERSKFADYDDLAAKAARLDEIDAERMTAEERAEARVRAAEEKAAAAEAKVAEAQRLATRATLAAEFGIAEDVVDLIDGPDEETMRSRAERLAAIAAPADAPAPVGIRLPGGRQAESGSAGDVHTALGRQILGLDN